MKKLLVGLVMWFVLCAVVGIAWHQAFGYTYEGAVDPVTFNYWDRIPEASSEYVIALKNPDVKSDVKAALLLVYHQPVATPNGVQYYSVIYKYCYLKGEVFEAFTLQEIDGEPHYAREVLDDETKDKLTELLVLCGGGRMV